MAKHFWFYVSNINNANKFKAHITNEGSKIKKGKNKDK
jgi:hypothetical protein